MRSQARRDGKLRGKISDRAWCDEFWERENTKSGKRAADALDKVNQYHLVGIRSRSRWRRAFAFPGEKSPKGVAAVAKAGRQSARRTGNRSGCRPDAQECRGHAQGVEKNRALEERPTAALESRLPGQSRTFGDLRIALLRRGCRDFTIRHRCDRAGVSGGVGPAALGVGFPHHRRKEVTDISHPIDVIVRRSIGPPTMSAGIVARRFTIRWAANSTHLWNE